MPLAQPSHRQRIERLNLAARYGYRHSSRRKPLSYRAGLLSSDALFVVVRGIVEPSNTEYLAVIPENNSILGVVTRRIAKIYEGSQFARITQAEYEFFPEWFARPCHPTYQSVLLRPRFKLEQRVAFVLVPV